MLRKILKSLGAIMAAFVLYIVCVGVFGRVETRYEFKGQLTISGNSQPKLLYAKLSEPKWWARIGSDNGIRLWVEIPNERVFYFSELSEMGEGFQIFNKGLIVGNLSQLSGALTLNTGEKSFYDGLGTKIDSAAEDSSSKLGPALWALIVGVVVFVLQQIISAIWLSPIQKLRETLGEIAYTLNFHARLYTNVPTPETSAMHSKACDRMRKLACRLRAQASVILFYTGPQRLRLVPELAKLDDAVGRMIRISNKSSLSADALIDTMIDDKNSVFRLLGLTQVDTTKRD